MAINVPSEIRRIGIRLAGSARDMMLNVVAEEVAKAARNNARSKGGRRFWVHDILNSIHAERDAGGMIVGSTHVAAAHKQFGGMISAPGKGVGSMHRNFLTIPVGEARDKRWDTDAAQASGYTLARIGKGSKQYLIGKKRSRRHSAVPRTSGRGNRGKAAESVLLFILKKSVIQDADPWFPLGKELDAAVKDGIDLYISVINKG